jgi:hypothetical protein
MRRFLPKLPEPTIREALVWVFIFAVGAAAVAGMATAPSEPISPDSRLTVADGGGR